ncbi:MAG: triose-phosphate isomerase [Pseudomonadota bacterium]
MRRPIVAANWKLNGNLSMVSSLLEPIDSFAKNFNDVDVVISPPFPYLAACGHAIKSDNVFLSAQSVAREMQGAFTGEVSAEMLSEMGCVYIIVGHSERRGYYGESDQIVADKAVRSLEAGLTPILCVGESLEQREQEQMKEVIIKQLAAVMVKVGIDNMAKMVIAYEPIWAIGTGKTATPEQAQEVHSIIRSEIAKQSPEIADGLRILYGGSVKASNAVELFSQLDIDGGLIGGASLDAKQFNAIVKAASALVITQ